MLLLINPYEEPRDGVTGRIAWPYTFYGNDWFAKVLNITK